MTTEERLEAIKAKIKGARQMAKDLKWILIELEDDITTTQKLLPDPEAPALRCQPHWFWPFNRYVKRDT